MKTVNHPVFEDGDDNHDEIGDEQEYFDMMMMMIMISTIIEYIFITHSFSVMATAPDGGVSGDEVWSDRKAAEEGGNITAINIRKSSIVFSIAMIRTR